MSACASSNIQMPRLLALDTSTERVLVAVAHGDQCWSRSAAGGAASSATLLPTIEAVLDEAGIALSALEAIAFCAGPGAFTGVRTGAAVAQGLAFAHELPVLALNALELLAAGDDGVTGVVIDARMNEVYFAAYRVCGGDLTELVAPAVGPAQTAQREFEGLLDAGLRLVGQPQLLAWADLADERCESRTIDARRLIDGASRAWRRGQATVPEAAQPLYVRNKVALTTAERAARNASIEAA
jgi:tRNA threonylcarbamoyladenosine biosynthesis protein TsaB